MRRSSAFSPTMRKRSSSTFFASCARRSAPGPAWKNMSSPMKPSVQPIDTLSVGVRGLPPMPHTFTRSGPTCSSRAVVKSTTTSGVR